MSNTGPGLYGLIACGGNSRRMGMDKSMLEYYGEPQCYWLYKMLQPFCDKVFISCNNSQARQIDAAYTIITDLPVYDHTGPMAGLLSAFKQYADKDILVIGCDYPFLTANDIHDFLNAFERKLMAAAFFNDTANLYEPLLAYYNQQSSKHLFDMHVNNEYSLQHFLKKNNAFKFYPKELQTIKSADTKEEYIKALQYIKQTL